MVSFEFTGGHLCLDFANTTDDRASDHPQEQLTDYARLVQWGVESGVLAGKTGERLRRLASAAPADALAALREGLRLREATFEIFSNVALGRSIPGPALASLSEFVRRAAAHAHLVRSSRRVTSEWIDPELHLDAMLWPVSRAAAELLTGEGVAHVRQCASETCSWLFLDRSKNHRRRWCDMKVCGNRDKARRYYRRQQAG
ncbi:MAG TPA: ABATE domain-containing protein [Gemmatimonadales bacterium]|nr:ABATE domain-containing protein [Gemmatimonadales bacterium]